MKSKINRNFFHSYLELEEALNRLLGVERGGVSAYIDALDSLSSQDASEIRRRLVRYRRIRNRLAHEADAFGTISEISPNDVKWLASFKRLAATKKDPLSLNRDRKLLPIIAFAVTAACTALFLCLIYFILKK